MPLYRDRGIVLRTHNLGEADRILTLLMQYRGLVRAVAKGVRRTASRFGGRLEPFSVVEVQCYEGRTLDTITQAESLQLFGAELSGDYERYRAAWVMAETAERVNDGEVQPEQFTLLGGALDSLARNLAPANLLRDSYVLRALGLAGWSPNLDHCVSCGAPGPHTAVMMGLGGVVCHACRQAGAIRFSHDAIALVDALARGDWETALQADTPAQNEAAGFTAAYAQWQLERGLKSLTRQRAGNVSGGGPPRTGSVSGGGPPRTGSSPPPARSPKGSTW